MSGQERFAEHRYFGPRVVDKETDDLGTKKRQLHPEEGKLYLITNTTAGNLVALLPKDCRNLETGFMFLVVNETLIGSPIVLKDFSETTTFATLQVGEAVMCWLVDNSSAAGTWRFKVTGPSGKQTVRT